MYEISYSLITILPSSSIILKEKEILNKIQPTKGIECKNLPGLSKFDFFLIRATL